MNFLNTRPLSHRTPTFSVAIYIAMFLLSGCEQARDLEISGATQGTTYHIKIAAAPNTVSQQTLHAGIDKILADIDIKLSNYRDDSEISHINQQHSTEWLTVSPEIAQLLNISKYVHERSKGCFDLTVKPLFDLWGFSRHENRVPAADEIAKAMQHVGMQKLEIDLAQNRIHKLDPDIGIDLSGIAQGYSVQMLANYLESQGLHNYLVEIGGEMKVKGTKADQQHWRVAIQKPLPNTGNIHRILAMQDTQGTAIMTAGTYRNFFEDHGKSYSHIIDPRTGAPVTHQLLSVTILHDDPTWADAWDTALLCMGEQEAQQLAESEALKVFLIYQTGNELKEYVNPAFTQLALPTQDQPNP